jgi:hypothetical protein
VNGGNSEGLRGSATIFCGEEKLSLRPLFRWQVQTVQTLESFLRTSDISSRSDDALLLFLTIFFLAFLFLLFYSCNIIFLCMNRFFVTTSLSSPLSHARTMASTTRLHRPLTRLVPTARTAQVASRLSTRNARFYSSKQDPKQTFTIWRPWLRLSIGIPFIGALIYSMVCQIAAL